MKATLRRRLRHVWLYAADKLVPPNDVLTPPRTLQVLVGGGDFKQIGANWLQRLITHGGLSPEDSVLDVGCGVGRLAIPLTSYLTSGRYDGFDVVPSAVDWCQRHITSRFPRFRFHCADVHNRFYNPTSRIRASEYQFPYETDRFDFVFGTSIFTHLLSNDASHYLAEIARVLRPQGRCLLTFFLLNDETRQPTASGRHALNFRYDSGGCWTVSRTIPELAVAYDEEWVITRYGNYGLTVIDPIHYGSWSGHDGAVSRQDFIVAVKHG